VSDATRAAPHRRGTLFMKRFMTGCCIGPMPLTGTLVSGLFRQLFIEKAAPRWPGPRACVAILQLCGG
jgi:hypothetical protein